jgi:hypothetical protein
MPLRDYSGNAQATTLAGAISATATAINVADATGYPTGAVGPFVITIDAGLAGEEKVLCVSRTGNTLTVATGGRGFDGTTAGDHDNAASVQHTYSATDAREANSFINGGAAALFQPRTAHASVLGTDQSALHATDTRMDLDTVESAEDGLTVDLAVNQIVVRDAGLYLIHAAVTFAPNTTGMRRLDLVVGSVRLERVQVGPAPGGDGTTVPATAVARLAAGAAVSATVFQNSGGTLVYGFGADATHLEVTRLGA